ncbi:hypothetical protein ACQ4M3_19285 [Leptolyngbya sp. AN03gr2]|uniref:hypothetical protein n=1 Tax=Leptolyngbya sp. AN03gr2 TaxID=3423364 RepID=UPI003D31923E
MKETNYGEIDLDLEQIRTLIEMLTSVLDLHLSESYGCLIKESVPLIEQLNYWIENVAPQISPEGY